MHQAESKYWITEENINDLITRDLFLKPATTGVITPLSEHWRYHCPTLSPNQAMLQLAQAELSEDDEDSDDSDDEYSAKRKQIPLDPAYLREIDYNQHAEQYITGEKEKIRDMLNAMIGDGADREKYDSIVREFVNLSENMNGPLLNMGKPKNVSIDKLPNIESLSKSDIYDLLADPTVSLIL